MTELSVYDPGPDDGPVEPPDDMCDLGKDYWQFAYTMLPQAGIEEVEYDDFEQYVESQVRLTKFLQVAAINPLFDGRGGLALAYRAAVNLWERFFTDGDESAARWMRRQRLAWMQRRIEEHKVHHAERTEEIPAEWRSAWRKASEAAANPSAN